MASLEELIQSLESDGVDVSEFKTPQPPIEQQEAQRETKGSILSGVKDFVAEPFEKGVGNTFTENPLGAAGAAATGALKASLDFTPNLTEKITADLSFPIIRGAEMAASMFLPEGVERPDFTTYQQVYEDNVLQTELLREKYPGAVEAGKVAAVAEGVYALSKIAVKNGPKILNKLANKFFQKRADKKLVRLAGDIAEIPEGPLMDAIKNDPEEVLQVLRDNPNDVTDLAEEVADTLKKTEKKLGKEVGNFRKEFVADPTIAVDTKDISSRIDNFKKATTSDAGVSTLSSKHQNQLKNIEKIISSGKGSISSKDAMLVLGEIDKMTLLDDIKKGLITPEAFDDIMDIRQVTKDQIRGNNEAWAAADATYQKFKAQSARSMPRLKDPNGLPIKDAAESYINNLFGKNKVTTRKNLIDVLNMSDGTDAGDAFFRRLSIKKAGQAIDDAKIPLRRTKQENSNQIINKWVSRGRGLGTMTGASIGFSTGGGLGGTFGALPGIFLGEELGRNIGRVMANPNRILSAARKSKSLSKKGKDIANDMIFIHKNYGNDGIIAFMDVIGPIPALAELTRFINSQNNKKGKQNGKN